MELEGKSHCGDMEKVWEEEVGGRFIISHYTHA